MRIWVIAIAIVLPRLAAAFCGFYVATGDKPMFNDATQVVLMRDGTRTVLSMQNNYKGPVEAFAMVIPVPVVLKEADVKVLPRDVFEHIEMMGSPRLVEYWEQDPCAPDVEDDSGGTGTAMALDEGKMGKKDGGYNNLGVKVEAKFAVGEYQIVVLSAVDSTGLDTWLRQEKYNIPNGAEPLLRPYVEASSKFFVAKVDPTKVKFEDGRAALSPLRVVYDSDQFNLPIRLGLANSSGTQDLIVNILASEQRYEVANYPNVTIPTNLEVKPGVKDRFAEFYVALFDETLARNRGAVVTEYAWGAGSCDPCPGPLLDYGDLATLGADVLPEANVYGMVLTRLHARYDRSITKDLEFSKAGPIVGGRELEYGGGLETGWRPARVNNFQARYIIRHKWTKPIACENPRRNVWGANPDPDEHATQKPSSTPATKLAFATRGELQLATAFVTDVPELKLVASAGPVKSMHVTKKSGCGCGATDAPDTALVIAIGAFVTKRRRRP